MTSHLRRLIGSGPIPVLSGLLRVQRGSPNAPASRRQRERFMQAYVDATSRLPYVQEVRVRDNVGYLDVYTLYRGDIRSFEDEIYEIEATTMRRFPDVRADWHLVDASRSDQETSEGSGSRTIAMR